MGRTIKEDMMRKRYADAVSSIKARRLEELMSAEDCKHCGMPMLLVRKYEVYEVFQCVSCKRRKEVKVF